MIKRLVLSVLAFVAIGSAQGIVHPRQLLQGGATSGQTLKWNGTEWAPADDDNDGGSALQSGYTATTDGTTTASASGSDTLKFRSADGLLTVAVGSNDPTHGDNVLFTVNEAALTLSGIGGAVTDGQVPDTITVDLAATAAALVTDPTDCSASQFAQSINTAGDLTCAAITISDLPTNMNLGGFSSFEVPNGLNPTTDAFGELAADSDFLGVGLGILQFFDGTNEVIIPGVLKTDTPTTGQVLKYSGVGTFTWEDDDDTGGAVSSVFGLTGAVDIVALSEDASPAASDWVVVEANAGGTFSKVQLQNLPGGVGGGSGGAPFSVTATFDFSSTADGVCSTATAATNGFIQGEPVTVAYNVVSPPTNITKTIIWPIITNNDETTLIVCNFAGTAVEPDGDYTVARGGEVQTLVKEAQVFGIGIDTATGDGKYYMPVGADLEGMNLVNVVAYVLTAGTDGLLNVDLARCDAVATGNVCSGTVADMLTTNVTIDSGEDDSDTAATAHAINASADDVNEGEFIRIDVDAVHSTTAATGLWVVMTFQLP